MHSRNRVRAWKRRTNPPGEEPSSPATGEPALDTRTGERRGKNIIIPDIFAAYNIFRPLLWGKHE